MRNFWTRLFSGVGFVLIMVAGCLVNRYLYAAVALTIMIVMMDEFYRMTMGKRHRFSKFLAILSGVTLFAVAYLIGDFGIMPRYLAVCILPLLIVMINALYTRDKDEMWEFPIMYMGIFYISLPITLANSLVFRAGEFDGMPLLCILITIWGSDVGGYLFGCGLREKFPKRLFPEISPKKTWIGAIGGAICAVVVSVLMKLVGMIDLQWVHVVLLPLIIDVFGVYGDLFESQWKRYAGVKDSGSIIPGHGGMLDRFDSSLFATPAAVLYLVLTGII